MALAHRRSTESPKIKKEKKKKKKYIESEDEESEEEECEEEESDEEESEEEESEGEESEEEDSKNDRQQPIIQRQHKSKQHKSKQDKSKQHKSQQQPKYRRKQQQHLAKQRQLKKIHRDNLQYADSLRRQKSRKVRYSNDERTESDDEHVPKKNRRKKKKVRHYEDETEEGDSEEDDSEDIQILNKNRRKKKKRVRHYENETEEGEGEEDDSEDIQILNENSNNDNIETVDEAVEDDDSKDEIVVNQSFVKEFSNIFRFFQLFSHIFTYFHIFSHIFTDKPLPRRKMKNSRKPLKNKTIVAIGRNHYFYSTLKKVEKAVESLGGSVKGNANCAQNHVKPHVIIAGNISINIHHNFLDFILTLQLNDRPPIVTAQWLVEVETNKMWVDPTDHPATWDIHINYKPRISNKRKKKKKKKKGTASRKPLQLTDINNQQLRPIPRHQQPPPHLEQVASNVCNFQ